MDQRLQQHVKHHVAQVRQRFVVHHQLRKYAAGRQFALLREDAQQQPLGEAQAVVYPRQLLQLTRQCRPQQR
ncbi:hypothetical protein D3C76_1409610 [compost metagenome]